MTNEHDAMQSLAASTEQAKQDAIRAKNIKYDFEVSESRKRANEIFWRSVMRFITHITLASIVIYALFHFA